MPLPASAHTAQSWRIHELTPDFRVQDVWALPTPGGPDDFPRLVELIAGAAPGERASPLTRALFAVRWKVGELLGWDPPEGEGTAGRRPTLRDRLPSDLRDTPGPEFPRAPFTSLYLLDRELAAEIVNRTVHAVMHLGWVRDPCGVHRGQMAVLVKPNGRLGAGYMAAIWPFRRFIVYPSILRGLERGWR